MSLIFLPSLAAFSLKGPDARKFLQGQLTCDINQLSGAQPLKGAHCNREGRVVALYDLLEQEGAIILITQRDLMSEAMKTLKHYGMFSKITWEDLSASHYVYADATGHLLIKPKTETVTASSDEAEFYYQKILKKEAFLSPETLGKFLPQELELSGSALSFTKGCYLGQEVVARVHYLGKLKRKLQVVESDTPLQPLTELFVDDKAVAEIVAAVAYKEHCYALALIQVSSEAKDFTIAPLSKGGRGDLARLLVPR